MAAESQPSSEYKSQFKWQPSKEIKPPQPKKAGCMSAEMGICSEPPFMRRKKSPERSYRTSIAPYLYKQDGLKGAKGQKKQEQNPEGNAATGAILAKKVDKNVEAMEQRGRRPTRGTKECSRKVLMSEYKSKYRLPWKFKIRTKESEIADAPSVEEEYWYRQVLELRRKADEYKKRAQGVNFSREHLAQLITPQAELWDLSSCNSSAISQQHKHSRSSHRRLFRLSEENLRTEGKEDIYISPRSLSSPPSSRIQEGGSDIEPAQTNLRKKKFDSAQTSVKRKLAWTKDERPKTKLDNKDDLHLCISSGPESDDEGGRVPTPDLVTEKSVRHHLDRTTPISTSLLLSPSHKRKTIEIPVDIRRYRSLPRTSTYVCCRDMSPSKKDPTSPRQARHSFKSQAKSRPSTGRVKDDLCDCGAAIVKTKVPSENVVKVIRPSSSIPQSGTTAQAVKPGLLPSSSKGTCVSEKKKRPSSADVRPSSGVSNVRDKARNRDGIHSAVTLSHPISQSPPTIRKASQNIESNLSNHINQYPDTSHHDINDDQVAAEVGSVLSSRSSMAKEVLQRARTRHKEFWGKNI